jgi:hypothetical protein
MPCSSSPFPSILQDECEEKRNGSDRHKRTLIEIFLCICHYRHACFFFGKAGNGRCAEAEKESTIEKERKTYLTCLSIF